MAQVAAELRIGATGLNLNDGRVRALARRVGSGTGIGMSDLRNKSLTILTAGAYSDTNNSYIGANNGMYGSVNGLVGSGTIVAAVNNTDKTNTYPRQFILMFQGSYLPRNTFASVVIAGVTMTSFNSTLWTNNSTSASWSWYETGFTLPPLVNGGTYDMLFA